MINRLLLCARNRSSLLHQPSPLPWPAALLAVAALGLLAGCSSSSSSSTTTPAPTLSTTANVLTVIVDGQPYVNGVYTGLPNALYATINICVPGTTTCQSVFNVQVDTGSSGLRLLSSAIYIPLTANTNSSGNVLANCGRYSDGSVQWGVMSTVDMPLAGELASSLPVQLIGAANAPPVPAGCAAGTVTDQPPIPAGANGVLGVGFRLQDCEAACVASPPALPATYFACSGPQCVPTSMPLANQLQNPVSLFPQDNTGVTIMLPDPGPFGSNLLQGSLVFGVGTQADNFLGSAQIQTPDANGHFTTRFNGVSNYPSRFATGARAYYFPATGVQGLAVCPAPNQGYYCTANQAPINLSATVTDKNNVTSTIGFSVNDAPTMFLYNFGLDRAFDNLGGPSAATTGFVWGLPFFYGRTVFLAIEGSHPYSMSATTVTPVTTTPGPFIAF